MPFGDGSPGKDRRRPGDHPQIGGKRDDDPDVDVAVRFVKWSKWLATKRIATTTLLMVLASAATWITVAVFLAPRVSALEASMTGVKSDLQKVQGDVEVLKSGEKAKLYILCTLYTRAIPNGIVPIECRELLR